MNNPGLQAWDLEKGVKKPGFSTKNRDNRKNLEIWLK
jgi:hypothetical protein